MGWRWGGGGGGEKEGREGGGWKIDEIQYYGCWSIDWLRIVKVVRAMPLLRAIDRHTLLPHTSACQMRRLPQQC